MLEGIKLRFREFQKRCAEEISSKRYQDAIKHTKKLILDDYISFLRTTSYATTRGKDIYDQFLCIRFQDTYIESALGIYFMVEEGFLNLAKRELRFLLESNLKHWLVDQEMMNNSFEEKMEKYEDIVPNSSIDFVKDFKHYALKENTQFHASAKSVYKDLCSYVHSSKSQNLERVAKAKRGQFLGFTSAKEVERINKLIFQTLELCIICQFNACGPSTTGDLFIQVLDADTTWKFHKSSFVQEVSKSYDYKHERQNK